MTEIQLSTLFACTKYVTFLFFSFLHSYASCLIERDRLGGKEVTIRVHSRLQVNQEVSTHTYRKYVKDSL